MWLPIGLLVVIVVAGETSLAAATERQMMSETDAAQSSAHGPVSKEYCEAETFKAACPVDHVILIRKALYGRMRLGRCVIRDYGYVGCHADILVHMDAQCSGSATCEVRIPDAVLDRANPCPKDFKTYLEVSYECVPVYTVKCKTHCNVTDMTSHVTSVVHAPNPVLMTSPTLSGFIMTDLNPKQTSLASAACLNRLCHVIVRAQPGQRLNITLLDFTLEEEERNQLRHQFHGVETCYRYAVIREMSRSRDIDVCGGLRRSRHVYASQNNELQIQFVSSLVHDRVPKFLVHYQVLGCADVDAPPNTWVRRDETTMMIYCTNGEQQVYQVHCVDNQWSGHVGSCTTSTSVSSKTPHNAESAIGANDQTDEYSTADGYSKPTGLFVAIVATLAIIMASFVLAVGIVAIRRCSPELSSHLANQKRRSVPSQYDVSDDVDDPMTTTNRDCCCNKAIITYATPLSEITSNKMMTSTHPDDVRLASSHHYECATQQQHLHHYQQQQLQQRAVVNSHNSPTTTIPLTTPTPHLVAANNYAKFDDVRYSAVRSSPADEFVVGSLVVEDGGVQMSRGLGFQLHCIGSSPTGDDSCCTCVNAMCSGGGGGCAAAAKYTPQLMTVAELDVDCSVSASAGSGGHYSTSPAVYGCS